MWILGLSPGRGGGYSGFLVIGMIEEFFGEEKFWQVFFLRSLI